MLETYLRAWREARKCVPVATRAVCFLGGKRLFSVVEEARDDDVVDSVALLAAPSPLLGVYAGSVTSFGRCHGAPVLGCVARPKGM